MDKSSLNMHKIRIPLDSGLYNFTNSNSPYFLCPLPFANQIGSL